MRMISTLNTPTLAVAGARWPMPRVPVLYTVAAAALLAGVLAAHVPSAGAAARGGTEPSLASLLRFMAVLKGAGVAAMLLLSHWRMLRPTPPRAAAAYIVAVGLAAAAPPLIWSMTHIVIGAAAFHCGLLLFLVCALRDAVVVVRGRRR